MNHATELTYTRVGDYFLPNLLPPPAPQVGIWGQRRRDHLRRTRNGLYTGMLLAGTLNQHLEKIDRQAEELFSQTVASLAIVTYWTSVWLLTDDSSSRSKTSLCIYQVNVRNYYENVLNKIKPTFLKKLVFCIYSHCTKAEVTPQLTPQDFLCSHFCSKS